MNKQQLKDFEETYLPQINQQLKNYLQGLDAQPYLLTSMTYSVMAGGKRIRPLLVLAVCHDLQKKIDQNVLSVAGSLELLHTYSLIHDDLPEMDNDDLRRGVPTNHKKFGQATAVLAGDALLTQAFEWLAQTTLPAKKIAELTGLLAHAAGAQGMVSGQMRDILGEKQQLNLKHLQQLHRQKTGALILYACQAGCVLADATLQQRQAVEEYGRNFGLAFQIYDDLLDETSTTEKMGKRVHKDQAEYKNTYPGLLGLEKSWQALAQTKTAAQEALNDMPTIDHQSSLLVGLLSYFSRGEKQ